MAPVILGPRCNTRVTCDPSPSNDRSESSLAVNPLDPYNMVGSSKRFTDPATYAFSLAAYATFDGGLSWNEAAPLILPTPSGGAPVAGTSDPAVAFDNLGDAYLVALPFGPGLDGALIGIAVYQSDDGGRTWGPPNLIHESAGDDKQAAVGDTNPASPFYGYVYAAWDDGTPESAHLRFARTTDNGATWKGAGAATINATSLASDSFAPAMTVAPDGTLYIAWVTGNQIKFVKSTDGGETFTAPAAVASGITQLRAGGLPAPNGFPELPGGTFRVGTFPTITCGTGGTVVVAWADYRDHVSRIYFRRSTNGGGAWAGPGSGALLLSGGVVSGADQHDFMPQLATTPGGEIGCTFYDFGPKGGGEFPPHLIDVVLAVSTDDGVSFTERATVSDHPWDPAVDPPHSHGSQNTTFIGDYFGFAASQLGFFPFWTDTRTGTQEIFTARVAVNPTDLYIRDSSADTGTLPSPGDHWEAPDLVVRRQPDGTTTFTNEDLLRDGHTEHYIYARVANSGPSTARNVRLAVTVGNYPSLIGLPGSEFRYPQDWYPGDWGTPALRHRHLFLGESGPIDIPAGTSNQIIGPVPWPAAQIPPAASWHPCLLAEVRCDNDDSAGGTYGCAIGADPDPCAYGTYFWGDNNICQRNLTYAPVPSGRRSRVSFPFLVGSVFSRAEFVDVIVDKGAELAKVPMRLTMEPVTLPGPDKPDGKCRTEELVFVDGGRVMVRVDGQEVGEMTAKPGTIWTPHCCERDAPHHGHTAHGGITVGDREWELTERRAGVGFPIGRGELRRMTLTFEAPRTLRAGSRPLIRIVQRNDHRIMTGGVELELVVH